MIEVSDKIYSYLSGLLGEDAAKKYVEFIKAETTQYIRVNSLKTSTQELSQKLLDDYGIKTEPVKNIPNALKVVKGKELTGKTIQHLNGHFYMQGLSSMIPPLILNPDENDLVLDLCAAPGSKTTELGEMMKGNGTLISNEVQLNRVKMLVHNIDKIGLTNCGVIQSKGEILSKVYYEYFDKILVDAPCSGLGIIQKKEEVSNWWSLKRAESLGELQMKLFVAAVKMCKVGGEIVYSTCTLTPEENEQVLNRILKKYPVEILDIELPVKSIPAFTEYRGDKFNPEISKAKRILPWDVDSDGFFIVKLKKTDLTDSPEPLNQRPHNLKFISANNRYINEHLKYLSDLFGISLDYFNNFNFLFKGKNIFFINNKWEDDNLGLFERIGLKLGLVDNRGKFVLHTQAAQVFENEITENIYEIENKDELKIYFEGGVIKKEVSLKGQCVVKYKGNLLGTAAITDAGIKSRYPRSKRTQEILF